MIRASCLTPPGRSALATVALVGSGSWQVARQFFHRRNKKPLPDSPRPGQSWLGAIGIEPVDEGILVFHQEDRVEFHLHGSPEAIRLLLEQLQQQGVSICTWDEFLEQTSESRISSLAKKALLRAPTTRTASILLDQVNGAYEKEWETIQFAMRDHRTEEAAIRLKELARWSRLGSHLVTPFLVVIAGPPNVGKSSLVNSLAGYQRSIVSPVAGTTRDVVTTRFALDGWPIELIDTAGLRLGGDLLENQGMERARDVISRADLVLWLIDGSGKLILPGAENNVPYYPVINKADLPAAWIHDPDILKVSTITGHGIGGLCSRIVDWLIPEIPPPGTAVPFTPELAEEVEKALQKVEIKT